MVSSSSKNLLSQVRNKNNNGFVNKNAMSKSLGGDSSVDQLDSEDVAELQWMGTKKNKNKGRKSKRIYKLLFVKLSIASLLIYIPNCP